MKFVHIADMHLDAVFSNVSDKNNCRCKIRNKQKNVFEDIIDYIYDNKIPYFFISGDLFEYDSIKRSTIEFIDKCFAKIEFCKIFITPGNHDPKTANSYYNTYPFSDNVYIFDDKIQKYSFDDVDIYGYGFCDFYLSTNELENFEKNFKLDINKTNIFITHCSLDNTDDVRKYNPIKLNLLKSLKFDYVALGHIHKKNLDSNIVYPGSTVCLGFDEIDSHGMIVGNINKHKLDKKFIPLDKFTFERLNINISKIVDFEQLIFEIEKKINNIKSDIEKFFEIVLTGTRNFIIDKTSLNKTINDDRIVKIKDETKLAVNISSLENDYSLDGLYFKNVNNLDIDEDMKNYLIELGLELFS